MTEGTEQCDDGVNNGVGPLGCLPGCLSPASCGDGTVEVPEICDDGVNNGDEGQCLPGCAKLQSCGDNLTQGTELCDDGVNDGGPGQCAPGLPQHPDLRRWRDSRGRSSATTALNDGGEG